MKQFCRQFAKLAMLAVAFVMLAWCMGTEADAASAYPNADCETNSPSCTLTVEGQQADVVNAPAQNAILMADSVTGLINSEVRVPLYLKNAAGLADVEGADGNLAIFQINVVSGNNLILTGFESELLAPLSPTVGNGNGIIIAFDMGSGISLSAITDDEPIAHLVFSSGSEVGDVSVSFSKAEFIDGKSANITDYSDYVETRPFTVTLKEPAELFDVYGSNMTLGNDLSMNFFIEKADLNGTDYYVCITKTYADGRANLVETIDFADWKSYSSALYYVTFDGIAAKEMCDEIYVTVYSGDGLAASTQRTESIRSYAMRILASSQPSALKTVAADMLNYGAAAQTALNYDTKNLANSEMTAEQQAYATKSISLTNSMVKGTDFYGSALSLESNIQLYMYFTNITTDMRAVVTYTDFRGNSVTENISGAEFVSRSSLKGVVVDSLVVADGCCLVTCEIYDGNTLVASGSDSMESICQRGFTSNATYAAVMKFVTSARAYLLG